MGDLFTETSYRGLGDNLLDSIKGVLVGLLMFLVSFPVLWWNEGRLDLSTVAKTAVQIAADGSGQKGEGKLVAVTAALASDGALGDPDFLKPGPFVSLERNVEMYAWTEKVTRKEKKRLGGGTTVVTTYEYVKRWTDDPPDSSEFRHPEGHENPGLPYRSHAWNADRASVGAFAFSPAEVEMPPARPLALDDSKLLPGVKERAVRSGDLLFIGKGSLEAPRIGDVRIRFGAVAAGRTVTFYGQRQGREIVAYLHKGKDKLFRVVDGTHAEAIATLHAEHKAITWFLRILGFLMMWIGMALVLGPFHAVFDIVPFVGSASRALAGIALFPIALVLTGFTIVTSMIFHSTVALLILLALFIGGGGLWIKRRAAARRAANRQP